MKVIIAGSRPPVRVSMEDVQQAVSDSGFDITLVISGTARGADRMGERWAMRNKIPIKRCPANWDLYGRAAGYKRNEEMADIADALIACWDGYSSGTGHMIDIAHKRGLKVHIHQV